MTQDEQHNRRARTAAALKLSARSEVAPFIVMDVMSAAAAREAAGHSIIHLEVGEPGAPTPRRVRDHVANAMNKGNIGYTRGIPGRCCG
jgi:aspartate/methionine/tyrosine aminotransferase